MPRCWSRKCTTDHAVYSNGSALSHGSGNIRTTLVNALFLSPEAMKLRGSNKLDPLPGRGIWHCPCRDGQMRLWRGQAQEASNDWTQSALRVNHWCFLVDSGVRAIPASMPCVGGMTQRKALAPAAAADQQTCGFYTGVRYWN